MKKLITVLMALLLCFGLTGCATLDYIFNGEEDNRAEPGMLPIIYESKIVAETRLLSKGDGYYDAEVNGMMKFDYYPNNIVLYSDGNLASIEPESVVYANVVANDNTISTWYVATFRQAKFFLPKINAGTSTLKVYAEDTKGTMYVTQTSLNITTNKTIYGCTFYNEYTGEGLSVLNDFGLENCEIMFELTGRESENSLDLSGWPIDMAENPLKYEIGKTIEIPSPVAFGYKLKGWQNILTGYVYSADANGITRFTSQGGALMLSAIWEKAPGVSFGTDIFL